MKPLALTIRDISRVHRIRKSLVNREALSADNHNYLTELLSKLPDEQNLLSNKIPLDLPLSVIIWDAERLEANLQQWIALFENIPSYNDSTSYETGIREPELAKIGTLIWVMFSPTLAHAMSLETVQSDEHRFELHLKGDFTAYFKLSRPEEAEQFSELYNFKGSWKEAYLLLIETLKKGWPMEEFPEELKPLLKK